MITGRVTADRTAVIGLAIAHPAGDTQQVEAVIDTGFNGYLTLPSHLIRRLGLQLAGNRRATLGDGHVVALDVYLGKLLWDKSERDVLVLQAAGGPLVGMSLLYGSRVTLNVVAGGDVIIEPLPQG
ncbi:MAG: clan AA aspartic protease [Planctomycetes bacterium]|nr:clan AA aspartic protease [Planctomycetota bacterium]